MLSANWVSGSDTSVVVVLKSSGGYSVKTRSTGTHTLGLLRRLFASGRFFKSSRDVCHAPFDQPALSQVMHTHRRATVIVCFYL